MVNRSRLGLGGPFGLGLNEKLFKGDDASIARPGLSTGRAGEAGNSKIEARLSSVWKRDSIRASTTITLKDFMHPDYNPLAKRASLPLPLDGALIQ